MMKDYVQQNEHRGSDLEDACWMIALEHEA